MFPPLGHTTGRPLGEAIPGGRAGRRSNTCFSLLAKRRSDTVVAPLTSKRSPRMGPPPIPRTLLRTPSARSRTRSPPKPKESSLPVLALVEQPLSCPIARTPPVGRRDRFLPRCLGPGPRCVEPQTQFEMRAHSCAPEGRGLARYPAPSAPRSTCPPKTALFGHFLVV